MSLFNVFSFSKIYTLTIDIVIFNSKALGQSHFGLEMINEETKKYALIDDFFILSNVLENTKRNDDLSFSKCQFMNMNSIAFVFLLARSMITINTND